MQKINITIKNEDSWNTVNRSNLKKVVENGVISCDGHYTDDYAYDAEKNCQRDLKSEECKKKILSDIANINYSYIKLYWNNAKKEFIVYYGQWLSYSVKALESLKLNFIRKKEQKVNSEIVKFAKKFEELLLLKLKASKVDCEGNRENTKTSIKVRNKYYAVDYGTSGKFLIDRSDNRVFSIKAYGQKGYFLGYIEDVYQKMCMDVETLNRVLTQEVRVYSLNY